MTRVWLRLYERSKVTTVQRHVASEPAGIRNTTWYTTYAVEYDLPGNICIYLQSHLVSSISVSIEYRVKASRPVSTEPICPRPSFLTGVFSTVNRLSDGRELTVSAGRLAKCQCPLSQFFLRISQSPVWVDTGLYYKDSLVYHTGFIDNFRGTSL